MSSCLGALQDGVREDGMSSKASAGLDGLMLPYLSGHTSGHQKLHAASDQGQQLRVPSLYCDETLSDHDTVYAENGLFHSRKGHGRGCHSWSTPKVLADITAATLSINELAPVAEKVPYMQHVKQSGQAPNIIPEQTNFNGSCHIKEAALEMSQVTDTHPGDCPTQNPVLDLPVYHNALYPLMCNSGPQTGQHQDYGVQYNKLMMQPTGHYYNQGYGTVQGPYWAFKNLPERVSWCFADDSAQISRNSLASMARIEVEREQAHLCQPLAVQGENHDLRRERCRAIRWISQRCTCWNLNRHTLFLAVAYLDKYIIRSGTSSGSLMLEGSACLSLACKMEEVVHPSAEEFCLGLDTTCTVKEFRERMNIVVMKLDWKLHIPNIYSFLKIFILHTTATDEVQAWGMYLAELCLMDASTLMFRPSVAAIACLTVALARCNAFDWRQTPHILQKYLDAETFAENEANMCSFIYNLIQLQHEAVQQARHDPNHYLRPVVDRFRSEKMCFVAELDAFDGDLAMVLSWVDS